jgi:hypothetical protein
MNINLSILLPVVLVAIALVIWLVFRNVKDERKFEHDIDLEDDLITREKIDKKLE